MPFRLSDYRTCLLIAPPRHLLSVFAFSHYFYLGFIEERYNFKQFFLYFLHLFKEFSCRILHLFKMLYYGIIIFTARQFKNYREENFVQNG